MIATNDNEKVGALRVLSALAVDISTDKQRIISREDILNAWFSEKSSSLVGSVALEYLTKMGKTEDYAVAKKEYERNDTATYQKALECMVAISLRTGHGHSAQKLILESSFDSLDSDILQAVLQGFDNLNTDELLLGLEHLNAQVRLRTLKVLLRRGSLDEKIADQMSKDSEVSPFVMKQ